MPVGCLSAPGKARAGAGTALPVAPRWPPGDGGGEVQVSLRDSELRPSGRLPQPKTGALHLPSGRPAGSLGDFPSRERSLGNLAWWAGGSPLGRALSWLPRVSSSPGRVLRPPLHPEFPGLFPQLCSLDLGGVGGKLRLQGEDGGQEPKLQTQSVPPLAAQLACGVLWLSGYGPIWSQNAADLLSSSLTLLEQLGPMVSKRQGAPR